MDLGPTMAELAMVRTHLQLIWRWVSPDTDVAAYDHWAQMDMHLKRAMDQLDKIRGEIEGPRLRPS